MADNMDKDRLVIVRAALDEQTGKWTARITIGHTMQPAGSFDTEEKAEAFALRFATEYIDGRTK